MIPIKDTVSSQTYPYINIGLILVNVGIFFYELSLGSGLTRFLYAYGLIPYRFFYLSSLESPYLLAQYSPFFSSLFIHGGWLHIIGNILYLWIFGDNVEDRMGHFRYLIFYLLCGISAGFMHSYLNPNSAVPAVGASGAISGVMGAYLILYPQARIITLVPLFFFFAFIRIPAFIFIGLWFIFQLFSGTLSLLIRGAIREGIGWWAHIGGFLSGIGLVFLFKKHRGYHRYYRK